jgi:hypothetical protein
MSNLKSKESKRKLRRWSFIVTIAHPDGFVEEFPDEENITYGTQKDANEASIEVQKYWTHQSKAVVKVIPEGHETISVQTLKQFLGMEKEIKVTTTIAMVACERWVNNEIPPAPTTNDTFLKLCLEVAQHISSTNKEIKLVNEEEIPQTLTNTKVDLQELQRLAYGPKEEKNVPNNEAGQAIQEEENEVPQLSEESSI